MTFGMGQRTQALTDSSMRQATRQRLTRLRRSFTAGIIGLGTMGEPMAQNLLKAGIPLSVYNRTPARCLPFKDSAHVAASARELMQAVEAIMLVVPDEPEINAVLERDAEGRIGAPIAGKLVLNLATTSPQYSEELAGAVTEAGGRYIESPVSGSRKPAEAGALVVLVAGADEDIAAVEPLFTAIGKATIRCGAPPSAMRMKLALERGLGDVDAISVLEVLEDRYEPEAEDHTPTSRDAELPAPH